MTLSLPALSLSFFCERALIAVGFSVVDDDDASAAAAAAAAAAPADAGLPSAEAKRAGSGVCERERDGVAELRSTAWITPSSRDSMVCWSLLYS